MNPAVLIWARERAGLSVEEVAEAMGRPAEVVAAWESGQAVPTYRQLETLAARCYKRPLAVFFFPAPPIERPLESEFRTLPATEFQKLESDTLYALREARAFQQSLREIADGANPADRLITSDIRPEVGEGSASLANRVRAYLEISTEQQFSWRDEEYAFKEWRNALESVGVFVFKRSFEQDDVSGCQFSRAFPRRFREDSPV